MTTESDISRGEFVCVMFAQNFLGTLVLFDDCNESMFTRLYGWVRKIYLDTFFFMTTAKFDHKIRSMCYETAGFYGRRKNHNTCIHTGRPEAFFPSSIIYPWKANVKSKKNLRGFRC